VYSTATRSEKNSKSNHVHEDEEVFEPVLRRGLVDKKARRGGIYSLTFLTPSRG
jgi:hypothetical protein